jgi:hypothetical protein
MTRLLTFLSVAALAPLVAGAPVPEDKNAASRYFPAKKGAKWVYADGTDEKVVVLSEVEAKGGTTVYTFVRRTAGGGAVPSQKLKLTEKGVFRIEVLGGPVEPPVCLLKVPGSNGLTWTESARDGPLDTRATYSAFGPEEVGVPAGRFKAIRVELVMDVTFSDGSKLERAYRQTNWYAPGLGCVKQVAGEAVEELKSFTPGKD